MEVSDATKAFAALGNETRLRLLRLLVQAGDDGLTVGALQRLVDVPASTHAHHLAILARAGLIVQERQGREVITRADFAGIRALTAFLTEACCVGVVIPLESDAA